MSSSLLVAVLVGACSDETEYRRSDAERVDTSPNDGTTTPPTTSATTVGTHAPFPASFGPHIDPPQAGQRYVYVLYPEGDSVAVIEAGGGGLATLRTGIRPSYLRVIPGTDDAVVLNSGSDEATLVRIDSEGALSSSNVVVIPGANSLVLARDGQHAIAYFDVDRLRSGEAFGDFQSVSLLDLTGANLKAVTVSVGFKPRAVYFQGDSQRAFVVTESEISIVALDSMVESGGGVAPGVRLSLEPTVPEGLQVLVGQSGKYALMHETESSKLMLLGLDDSSLQSLDVADYFRVNDAGEPDVNGTLLENAFITDVSQSGDGSFAVAAVDAQNAVVRVPIPEGFEDPGLGQVALTSELSAGRVSLVPESDLVIAYPAAGAEKVEKAAVADFGAEPPVTSDYVLRKGIESVWVSPGGTVACLVHSRTQGDPLAKGLDFEARLDRSYGYTLLRPGVKDVLQISEAKPDQILATPGDEYLFIMFNDENAEVREVQKIDVNSLGVEVPLVLDSAPTALGALMGANTVFVNQNHPDGRITFIDWPDGETTTVTGFELNSRIRN